LLKESPYTQKDADRAAGLQTADTNDDPFAAETSKNAIVDEDNLM
jgi:hypothetical protein